MFQNPLVSVIVPIYNGAAYLEQCLASLQNQTWRHMEMILINDGSTDNSLEICEKTVSMDSRFQLINQPNKGVSAARNAGLAAAKGTYIQFVDGDDYLPVDATETLVKKAKATSADLIIAHFYRVSGGKQVQQGHIKEDLLLTRSDFAQQMIKAPANFYYGALWNKLYRHSIITANGLQFEPELNWCEDFLFNLEFIRYSRLIAAVSHPVYYYIKRPNSLVSTQSTLRNTIRTKKITFTMYKELYRQLDLFDNQKARIYKFILASATDGSCISPPALPQLLKQPEKTADTRIIIGKKKSF